MSQFIENINTYLSALKIKHSFISLKTGIESSKLSRILKSAQDITSSDMEKIAGALGKKAAYFMAEDFHVPTPAGKGGTEAAFYAGEPGEAQEAFALKIIDLIKNVDEVLGAQSRLLTAAEEQINGI